MLINGLGTNVVGILIQKHQIQHCKKDTTFVAQQYCVRNAFPKPWQDFASRTLAALVIPKRQNESTAEAGAAGPGVGHDFSDAESL